ncbi:hypothetical protein EYR40_008663 [Pleurotus pulmonarius]|nr:hypothetical protein EYR36_009482 [Pleurotus pulmonarius]KAF4593869.1 hypothetical protein EYR40_008663 [Pleurotus pulmonarius]
MPCLTDVPVEVLIDNLLPQIALVDLLSLTCTNKFFAIVCSDETFWKRKLERDFNFSPTATARNNGFKILYKGVRRPHLFVWGAAKDGRLGRTEPLPTSGAPYPLELRIPNVRIVSLVAGGMSFHALDSEGNVYVWGTMDGTTFALNRDGYSEPGKTASTPLKLQMPAPTRNISCGRLHSATIDVNQHVWTFLTFGTPFRLSSPLLDNDSPETSPLQVECGWNLTSVLTKSGDVVVWWPFGGQMKALIDQKHDEMHSNGAIVAPAVGGSILCAPWELSINPKRLPRLPQLPDLSGESNESPPKLIQIAALDSQIIGLTDQGHVVKFSSLVDEQVTGEWQYLPNFSEVNQVRSHTAFADDGNNRLSAPSSVKITHISANYQRFFAYSTGSSSLVLMGSLTTGPSEQPVIIPALQYKSIISVVVGDYHYGALTSTGKLLTWGAYSSGALGLGDPLELPVGTPGGFPSERLRLQAFERGWGQPPDVEVPSEVRFDHDLSHPRDRFCFAVTAAGWHMGALVMDLEASEDDDTVADPLTRPEHRNEPPQHARFPVPLPQPPYHTSGPGQVPMMPLAPGYDASSSVFRVGFPGRGGTPANSHQGPSTSTLHPQAEPPVPGVSFPSLGRGVRIGFAGRGLGRGTSGRGQGGVGQ